ncbi:MAG: hypothetical protein KDK78_01635 [Chlamydiia bacterium]|nr:hypothetical protein [Chlamydiia bacterium]
MRSFLAALLLCGSYLGATELRPWFGEDLWLESRLTHAAILYDHVDSDLGQIDRHTSDNHSELSSMLAADDWLSAELELAVARRAGKGSQLSFDRAGLTVRYWAQNDIAGDPFALILGASVFTFTEASQRDPTTLCHGDVHGEVHVSLGKEWACGPCWERRAWVVGAFGLADRGRSYWRAQSGYEHRMTCSSWAGLHLKAQGGMGDHALVLDDAFRGYGRVAYRVVDLSAEYTFDISDCGELSAGYSHRIEARNAPQGQQIFYFSVMWRAGVI